MDTGERLREARDRRGTTEEPASASDVPVKAGDLILVTGAAGFIGSYCVYELLNAGFRVRATARDAYAQKNLFLKSFHPKAGENVEVAFGDLLKSHGWGAAMEGVDGVLHVASPFPMVEPEDEQHIIAPAISGVENVLKAAASAKVKRVVVTSSAYAVFQGKESSEVQPGRVFTEDDWSAPEVQSGYPKSKTLAEMKAWELAKSCGVDVVTILPGLVVGRVLSESAGKDSASNQMITDMMLRKHSGLPHTGFPIVDVQDVAMAHIRALTAPKETVVGKRFIAAGEDVITLTEIASILNDEFEAYGFSPPTKELSTVLLRFMSWFNTDAANALKMVSPSHHCSGNRTRHVLGVDYKSIRLSLKEHVLSLIALGILPAREVPEEMYAPFKMPPQRRRSLGVGTV